MIHPIKSPKDLPTKPLKLMTGDVEKIQKLYPDKNIWHFTTTYGWYIIAVEE